MSSNSMTPKQAAAALIAAMPVGVSVQQLEEYGIDATEERAQAITQEVLSLNLFWILAAIEAHIPQKYQSRCQSLFWRHWRPDGERPLPSVQPPGPTTSTHGRNVVVGIVVWLRTG